jgi:hypothetical protein
VQAAFLALVPVIRSVARTYFRGIRCSHGRDDAVCETVALAWRWHVRLAARGRDAAQFPITFARLAAKAVACGRRLAGGDRINDVMTLACRWRRGFAVVGLPAASPAPGTEIAEALAANTKSRVSDLVQTRLDLADWRAGLRKRTRLIVDQLALGHGTGDVARMVGLTAARVSQLRDELRRNFLRFLSGPGAG